MVRSDNSVNRECLWLDLPMDHRKMLYNHCASGILEASKKDPALTDLRFLQLSAGHSQTNLSGVFCLSFKTICVLHAHSRRDASKLPSDYIANANSTPDVFYDLTDTLPWWKATAQDLPCWATAVQKMVLSTIISCCKAGFFFAGHHVWGPAAWGPWRLSWGSLHATYKKSLVWRLKQHIDSFLFRWFGKQNNGNTLRKLF